MIEDKNKKSEETDKDINKKVEEPDPQKGMAGKQYFCNLCKHPYVIVQDNMDQVTVSFRCPECRKILVKKLSGGYWGIFKLTNVGGSGNRPMSSVTSIWDSSNMRKKQGLSNNIVKAEKKIKDFNKKLDDIRKKYEKDEVLTQTLPAVEPSIENIILDLVRSDKITLTGKNMKETIDTVNKELSNRMGITLSSGDIKYILRNLKLSLMKNFDSM